MAGPTITYGTAGNLSASASLANASPVTVTADFSTTKFGGLITAKGTGGGTVAATNGLRVQIFELGDTVPTADTIATTDYTIPMTTSTVAQRGFRVPTGKYSVKITNLDTSNTITAQLTSSDIG